MHFPSRLPRPVQKNEQLKMPSTTSLCELVASLKDLTDWSFPFKQLKPNPLHYKCQECNLLTSVQMASAVPLNYGYSAERTFCLEDQQKVELTELFQNLGAMTEKVHIILTTVLTFM